MIPSAKRQTGWMAVLFFASCGGGDPAGHPARHVDELPGLALVEELRIGSRDDPDVGFTRIGATVHVESDGVWVAETADRQIRFYSLSGELLRTIGREGEGPGDFRSVGPFGFVGDTLWVRDGSLRRVTLFTRQGELLGTVSGSIEIPFTDDRGFTRSISVYPGSLRPDGLFESEANIVLHANLPDSMIMLPTVLFDATGAVVDTLEVVPTRISRTTRTIEWDGNRRTFITVNAPPPDSIEWTTELEDDTVRVSWHVPTSAEDALFQVERKRPTGDTLYHHRFRYDPMPVTEAHLDSLAARQARGRDPADSARIHEVAREVMRRPSFHRPVWQRRAGEDGSFWVELNGAAPDTSRWIVLNPDGEVRGVLALPSTTVIRRADSDRIWVAEIDELDVPWLVRYRIEAR